MVKKSNKGAKRRVLQKQPEDKSSDENDHGFGNPEYGHEDNFGVDQTNSPVGNDPGNDEEAFAFHLELISILVFI